MSQRPDRVLNHRSPHLVELRVRAPRQELVKLAQQEQVGVPFVVRDIGFGGLGLRA